MISRRQLLSGKLTSYPDESHPPWAITATRFVESCTRCDACLDSCPLHIIKHNKHGFPVVDFSESGCTFCAECVNSCENNSLSMLAFIGTEPWSLKATITRSCVNYHEGLCRICAEACAYSAIRFQVSDKASAIPEIDLDNCTGCGQCYRICPQRAIRVKPA